MKRNKSETSLFLPPKIFFHSQREIKNNKGEGKKEAERQKGETSANLTLGL